MTESLSRELAEGGSASHTGDSRSGGKNELRGKIEEMRAITSQYNTQQREMMDVTTSGVPDEPSDFAHTTLVDVTAEDQTINASIEISKENPLMLV